MINTAGYVMGLTFIIFHLSLSKSRNNGRQQLNYFIDSGAWVNGDATTIYKCNCLIADHCS